MSERAMFWRVVVVLLLACSAPVLPGCSGEEPPRSGGGGGGGALDKAVDVQLATVEQRQLPVAIEVSGSLHADETVTISAKVAGRIAQIRCDLGDQLAPGALLAALDPTDYQLEIQQKILTRDQVLAKLGLSTLPTGSIDLSQLPTVQRSNAQAQNAKANFERLRSLHEKKMVSDQDFNDAQTAAEVAMRQVQVALLEAKALLAEVRTRQSELAAAQQRLSDSRILAPAPAQQAGPAATAPAAGASAEPSVGAAPVIYQVAQRLVSQGEYVREGTPLFRLIDDNPVRLRLDVPERHAAVLTVGLPVQVRVQAFAEMFAGQVSRISPEVNAANRTFPVEVTIDNSAHRLKPGSFAVGAIETPADAPTLLVPQQAVTTFAGVSKVFTVVDGKAREIKIKPGAVLDSLVVALEGLSAEMQVISPVPSRLVSGQKVNVQK